MMQTAMPGVVHASRCRQLTIAATGPRRPAHVSRTDALRSIAVTPDTVTFAIWFRIWKDENIMVSNPLEQQK